MSGEVTSPSKVVEFQNVNVVHGRHHTLQDINFSIEEGEIVALIGPNGAGKTTLIRALLDLIPLASGRVRLFGSDPKSNRNVLKRVGYVPQRISLDRSLPLRVDELIASFSREKSRNAGILEAYGLHKLAMEPIGALSGGQFQKLLLVLALLNDPELIILDEPVSSVDAEGIQLFYDLIKDLRGKDRRTIIITSHDLNMVYEKADRVVCINHRLVCVGHPEAALTEEVLRELFSGASPYGHRH